MEKLIIKKIWFNQTDKKPDIFMIDDYANAKENDCIRRDKLSEEEWKAYIFGTFNKGSFAMRESITIEPDNNTKSLNINDEVEINLSERNIIGKGTIVEIDKKLITLGDLELYINKDYTNVINELFYDYKGKDLIKYINGLFKINYDYIKYSLSNHYFNKDNTKKGKDKNGRLKNYYDLPEGKFNAYCSYLAIKDLFKSKGYNVSQLDCFIKGHKLEYDALLLKDTADKNERLFDAEDVLATIEIKTCGFFYNKGENISKKFENYLIEEKIDGIPHLYIAVRENSKIYNETRDVSIKDCAVLFCNIVGCNDYVTVPMNNDIDELLKIVK